MTVAIRYEPEHAMLRAEARRWLTEHGSMPSVRRFAEDARGDDRQLWPALATLGWLGLLIPAAHGGAGLGITHAAVVLEEAGRHLLCAPLLPLLLTGLALELGGSEAQRTAWLPRLAAGEALVTLAHVQPSGAWQADSASVSRHQGTLSGEQHSVWAAATADAFLVLFADREAPTTTRLALVDARAAGVEIEPEVGLDPTRRSGRVRLRDVHVAEDAILPRSARDVFAVLLPQAWTLLAAEMAGGADALLKMTADYVATRVQFGRPIGSFQAVKHPLVNVLIGVEQTRSLVYAAAAAVEAGAPEAEMLARMAKAHASDVYAFAASRAIQFHGGFGFTYDCDAHLYLKRAQASRPAFGDATHHRRWIAAALIDAPRSSKEHV